MAIEVVIGLDADDDHFGFIGFRPPLDHVQLALVEAASRGVLTNPLRYDDCTEYQQHKNVGILPQHLRYAAEYAVQALKDASYDVVFHKNTVSVTGNGSIFEAFTITEAAKK